MNSYAKIKLPISLKVLHIVQAIQLPTPKERKRLRSMQRRRRYIC